MTQAKPATPVTPDARAAAGAKGFKAELDGLRDRMRSFTAGGHDQDRAGQQAPPEPAPATHG